MFEFINTALLILLVNTKVPEMHVPEDFPILSGNYADFNVPWYRNVGSIIMLTMLINILIPTFADNLVYLKTIFVRWKDRGYTTNQRITKKVLQEDYNELYTGEDFLLEVRYA